MIRRVVCFASFCQRRLISFCLEQSRSFQSIHLQCERKVFLRSRQTSQHQIGFFLTQTTICCGFDGLQSRFGLGESGGRFLPQPVRTFAIGKQVVDERAGINAADVAGAIDLPLNL